MLKQMHNNPPAKTFFGLFGELARRIVVSLSGRDSIALYEWTIKWGSCRPSASLGRESSGEARLLLPCLLGWAFQLLKLSLIPFFSPLFLPILLLTKFPSSLSTGCLKKVRFVIFRTADRYLEHEICCSFWFRSDITWRTPRTGFILSTF